MSNYRLLLVLALGCHAPAAIEPPTYRQRPVADAPTAALPFAGITLAGAEFEFEPRTLERPTLLVFWASWCKSCRAELPALKKLHESGQLQLVGVCVDKDPKLALALKRAYDLPYPSVSDPGLHIADRYHISGTPTLILIERGGEIVLRANHVDGELRQALP